MTSGPEAAVAKDSATPAAASLWEALAELAPGSLVLDVGAAGACVEAPAGLALEITSVDPREHGGWPLCAADAAIFLAREPAPQLRVLRRVRRHLRVGALLIADAHLRAVVREAGFELERADAQLLLARALPAPPDALAVASWTTPPGVRLDLRYAPEEADLLEPSPSQLWREVLDEHPDRGAELASSYAVDDPYGGERGAPVLAGCFDCELSAEQVTFAAGVTALLHDLSALADGGLVLAPSLTHPDLPAWAITRGSETRLIEEATGPEPLAAHIRRARPALVMLDRPSFTAAVLETGELATVARAAADVDALVVVDESAAQYLGPLASTVRIAPQLGNLVVLRGFTKAYSWGGLRAGFAVASPAVASWVRELVTPLQVGGVAFEVALRALAAGDAFTALREQIHVRKPPAAELLRACGLEVSMGHRDIPWVTVRDPDGTISAALARRGVVGLRAAPVPGTPPAGALHLTVPLSEERAALFEQLLPEALS